jgi:hypothetical protein
VPQVRITIPEPLWGQIEAQRPHYLDRSAFLCLLLDRAVKAGEQPQERYRFIGPEHDRRMVIEGTAPEAQR